MPPVIRPIISVSMIELRPCSTAAGFVVGIVLPVDGGCTTRWFAHAPLGTNPDALLQAAIQCLQEHGYAHTSARDLVAASCTNLGAIGYHFGSKEPLLNEAITHHVRE